MLAGVVLTVAAPLIPVLAEDFRGRPETPAHRSARPVRAVTPRPPRPKPAPAPAADPSAAPDQDEAQAAVPAEGTFTAEEAYGRADEEVTASAGAPADATVRPEPLDDALTVTGAYRALGFEGERRDE